jgi:hypothetical protein
VPVSADGQFEIASAPALLMGAGTPYEVLTFGGWGARPTDTHDLKLQSGGVYAARDAPGPVTYPLDVEILGQPGSDIADKMAALAKAWKTGTNVDVRLTWQEWGLRRYALGRARRFAFTLDSNADQGYVKAAMDFFSPSGLIFDAADDLVVDF